MEQALSRQELSTTVRLSITCTESAPMIMTRTGPVPNTPIIKAGHQSKTIVGGAAFVAKSYIHAGQESSLYKMRWNPESMATKGYASHQYATDIGWAVKQTARMAQIYGLLTQYTLLYDIPSYKE